MTPLVGVSKKDVQISAHQKTWMMVFIHLSERFKFPGAFQKEKKKTDLLT
jgi:hypothetical protein